MSTLSKEEKKQRGAPQSPVRAGLTIEPVEHQPELPYTAEQKIETPKQKLASSDSGHPSKENTPAFNLSLSTSKAESKLTMERSDDPKRQEANKLTMSPNLTSAETHMFTSTNGISNNLANQASEYFVHNSNNASGINAMIIMNKSDISNP